jgi:hypothetical protein
MKILIQCWFIAMALLAQDICWGATLATAYEKAVAQTSAVIMLQWIDLVPEEERAHLVNPATINHTKTSEQARNNSFDSVSDFGSSNSLTFEFHPVQTWHLKTVKISGYIVPGDFKKNGDITGFFLTPSAGACLHIPPPPPNQVIYVRYPQGLSNTKLYEPFSVTGLLKVERAWKELADSQYTLIATTVKPYVAP